MYAGDLLQCSIICLCSSPNALPFMSTVDTWPYQTGVLSGLVSLQQRFLRLSACCLQVRSAKCGMGISNMPWCFLAIAFQPCSQLQQMPLVCRAIRSAWGNPSLRQQRVFPEGSQLVSKVFQSAAKSAACMSASATHDTASVATSLGISNAPPLATVGGGHSECMCMSCMKQ